MIYADHHLLDSFPFFHWPSYEDFVRKGEHKRSRSACVLILAVAALASARIRDQASLSPFDSNLASIPAEAWSRACLRILPRHHASCQAHTDAFNYMRTYALLAILSVQDADLSNFQLMLGRYLALSAVHSFHQESRWSSQLSGQERDERRLLVCSLMMLEKRLLTASA